MSSVCSRVRVCSERSPTAYLLYIVFIIIMDNFDMEQNTQERLLQDREETTVQADGVNEKSKPMQKILKKTQKQTKLKGPKATKQTLKAATNAVEEEDETLDPRRITASLSIPWLFFCTLRSILFTFPHSILSSTRESNFQFSLALHVGGD